MLVYKKAGANYITFFKIFNSYVVFLYMSRTPN